MKIEWVTTTVFPYSPDTLSGGSFYDYLATKVLSEKYNFELIWIKREKANGVCQRIVNEYSFIKNLSQLNLKGNVIIRTHFAVALAPYKRGTKNIAIIHQFCKSPTFDAYYLPFFLRNLKKIDIIVTVSKYWQNWVHNKGCKDVKVIYNPFNVEEFIFSNEEICEFKQKYNLADDKPIIYIGSSGKKKGVEKVYNILKDLDVYLVSSGRDCGNKPFHCLTLSYRDYLCLLKCSTLVIQMSENIEGWCRVLHEAMLCKTPVIGSGKGGMAELLSGGGQIICTDFKDLKYYVKRLLVNENLRKELRESGYEFAKIFTYERFRKEWIQLIKDVVD